MDERAMDNINVGRVIVGGLLAGLIINVGETILNLFVVAQGMDHALKARNLPPIGGGAIGGFILLAFLLGIATVWLYAAIRPRFGAGVWTAAVAGLAVWFFAYLYKGVGQDLMGFFPAGLTILTLVWGLAEIILGAMAGSWLYRE